MLIARHAASPTKRYDIAQKTALYYTENYTILHEKMHYIAREISTKEWRICPFLTYPPIIYAD